jgi:hypothetical protein
MFVYIFIRLVCPQVGLFFLSLSLTLFVWLVIFHSSTLSGKIYVYNIFERGV